jgi:hypothetical protein
LQGKLGFEECYRKKIWLSADSREGLSKSVSKKTAILEATLSEG